MHYGNLALIYNKVLYKPVSAYCLDLVQQQYYLLRSVIQWLSKICFNKGSPLVVLKSSITENKKSTIATSNWM